MENIISLILGGGKGTRLYPLTKSRSKPAVPFGGQYRIIDVPVSNCINSNILKMFVVTQFNSKSLNHHINHAYRFDTFSHGFVDILAAELTNDNVNWYQGTADAVRRNLRYIQDYSDCDTVLILSGDQLYRMDFRKLYEWHLDQKADMTLATLPVLESKVPSFGIMKVGQKDGLMRVKDFAEKPKDTPTIKDYRTSAADLNALGFADTRRAHLASMGIYMFKKEVLIEALTKSNEDDFGHNIIPNLIAEKEVAPYIFNGYWEDIGTIRSFHEANLALVGDNPAFELYRPDAPFFTNPRFLPPSFVDGADIDRAILGEGSRILGGFIHNSMIGVRSVIRNNATLKNVVMLGADFYEKPEDAARAKVPMGIGEDCIIHDAIIDKNARIGKGVRITNEKQLTDYDPGGKAGYCIRDGIVVIEKNAIIPDGTVI